MKKLLLSFILIPVAAVSQIVITGAGSTTQNFDALLNSGSVNPWTDNALIPGWYSQRTTPSTLYTAGTGSSTTGGLYSFGAVASTERALGTIGSNNTAFGGSFAHGVLFHNTSGGLATTFTVSFTMEQWRNSGSTFVDELTFWYKVSSSPIASLDPGVFTGWTQVVSLSTFSPTFTAGAGALDGNLPANQVVVSSIVIPTLVLADGEYLMLKWDDPDHADSDHGLSIDNATISWSFSCSTLYYADSDDDGFGDPLSTTTGCVAPAGYVSNSNDCDDTNDQIYPGATEVCDGVDNDCLNGIDDGLTFTNYYTDADGDNYGNSTVQSLCSNPGAGYSTATGDCDDTNDEVYPGASEICDGLDNDCVNGVDDGLTFANYYTDADGDNYGTGAAQSLCSNPGAGFATVDGDCDDSNANAYPGATEIADNDVDENCDLIDNYASIEQQSMSKVSVYPNPTNGLVTLTFSQELSDAYVVITNVLGEEVYSENISGKQKHELNLDKAIGVYFVTIYDQGNLITVMKVVKQ